HTPGGSTIRPRSIITRHSLAAIPGGIGRSHSHLGRIPFLTAADGLLLRIHVLHGYVVAKCSSTGHGQSGSSRGIGVSSYRCRTVSLWYLGCRCGERLGHAQRNTLDGSHGDNAGHQPAHPSFRPSPQHSHSARIGHRAVGPEIGGKADWHLQWPGGVNRSVVYHNSPFELSSRGNNKIP